MYDEQLLVYLRAFRIPEDYQEKIFEAQSKLEASYSLENERKALQGRLNRVKELYEWGHKNRKEYLADYTAIHHKLQELTPADVRLQANGETVLFFEEYCGGLGASDPGRMSDLRHENVQNRQGLGLTSGIANRIKGGWVFSVLGCPAPFLSLKAAK